MSVTTGRKPVRHQANDRRSLSSRTKNIKHQIKTLFFDDDVVQTCERVFAPMIFGDAGSKEHPIRAFLLWPFTPLRAFILFYPFFNEIFFRPSRAVYRTLRKYFYIWRAHPSGKIFNPVFYFLSQLIKILMKIVRGSAKKRVIIIFLLFVVLFIPMRSVFSANPDTGDPHNWWILPNACTIGTNSVDNYNRSDGCEFPSPFFDLITLPPPTDTCQNLNQSTGVVQDPTKIDWCTQYINNYAWDEWGPVGFKTTILGANVGLVFDIGNILVAPANLLFQGAAYIMRNVMSALAWSFNMELFSGTSSGSGSSSNTCVQNTNLGSWNCVFTTLKQNWWDGLGILLVVFAVIYIVYLFITVHPSRTFKAIVVLVLTLIAGNAILSGSNWQNTIFWGLDCADNLSALVFEAEVPAAQQNVTPDQNACGPSSTASTGSANQAIDQGLSNAYTTLWDASILQSWVIGECGDITCHAENGNQWGSCTLSWNSTNDYGSGSNAGNHFVNPDCGGGNFTPNPLNGSTTSDPATARENTATMERIGVSPWYINTWFNRQVNCAIGNQTWSGGDGQNCDGSNNNPNVQGTDSDHSMDGGNLGSDINSCSETDSVRHCMAVFDNEAGGSSGAKVNLYPVQHDLSSQILRLVLAIITLIAMVPIISVLGYFALFLLLTDIVIFVATVVTPVVLTLSLFPIFAEKYAKTLALFVVGLFSLKILASFCISMLIIVAQLFANMALLPSSQFGNAELINKIFDLVLIDVIFMLFMRKRRDLLQLAPGSAGLWVDTLMGDIKSVSQAQFSDVGNAVKFTGGAAKATATGGLWAMNRGINLLDAAESKNGAAERAEKMIDNAAKQEAHREAAENAVRNQEYDEIKEGIINAILEGTQEIADVKNGAGEQAFSDDAIKEYKALTNNDDRRAWLEQHKGKELEMAAQPRWVERLNAALTDRNDPQNARYLSERDSRLHQEARRAAMEANPYLRTGEQARADVQARRDKVRMEWSAIGNAAAAHTIGKVITADIREAARGSFNPAETAKMIESINRAKRSAPTAARRQEIQAGEEARARRTGRESVFASATASDAQKIGQEVARQMAALGGGGGSSRETAELSRQLRDLTEAMRTNNTMTQRLGTQMNNTGQQVQGAANAATRAANSAAQGGAQAAAAARKMSRPQTPASPPQQSRGGKPGSGS